MDQTLTERIVAANDELIDKGNAGAVADFFSPEYVVHVGDRDLRGHRAVESFLAEIRKSFADLRVEVEILTGDDTRLAWQRTFRATHEATFRGFPASGKPLSWRDMLVTRFEDGLIVEEWAVSDLAERLLAARR